MKLPLLHFLTASIKNNYLLNQIPITTTTNPPSFSFNAAQLAAIQTSHGKHIKIHTPYFWVTICASRYSSFCKLGNPGNI